MPTQAKRDMILSKFRHIIIFGRLSCIPKVKKIEALILLLAPLSSSKQPN